MESIEVRAVLKKRRPRACRRSEITDRSCPPSPRRRRVRHRRLPRRTLSLGPLRQHPRRLREGTRLSSPSIGFADAQATAIQREATQVRQPISVASRLSHNKKSSAIASCWSCAGSTAARARATGVHLRAVNARAVPVRTVSDEQEPNQLCRNSNASSGSAARALCAPSWRTMSPSRFTTRNHPPATLAAKPFMPAAPSRAGPIGWPSERSKSRTHLRRSHSSSVAIAPIRLTPLRVIDRAIRSSSRRCRSLPRAFSFVGDRRHLVRCGLHSEQGFGVRSYVAQGLAGLCERRF